jgi:aspartyl-tRNA synthetase
VERVYAGDLAQHIDKRVLVQGWAHAIRNQKTVQFVIVRDHTGLVQATHRREGDDDAVAATIDTLTREAAIEVAGTVVRNEIVELRGIEIVIDELRVAGPAAAELPIGEDPGIPAREDWRYLVLRKPEQRLIFEVQTAVERAMRGFWHERDFIEIHSPKLMGSASESGSELFQLEHFGRTAYLAQSPQFYKQMAMAAGFERVFEIGPVFRANPSFTARHDTEFTSVDVEISWIASPEDVMTFEEQWLRHVLSAVRASHGDAIRDAFGVEVVVPELPFPRLTMREAYDVLAERGHRIEREKGDLDPEGERELSRYVAERFGHEFVFVTDYPASARPFYHMRDEADRTLTRSFDLIWKGIEITTGAQREHRYDTLRQQAEEAGVALDGIEYYLDFFKYGCPPHGGFGFGLTRMLMVLLGQRNVRDVTYLYRGPNRLSP